MACDFDDKVCGDCRLWRKGETDPHNLNSASLGECRLQPHMLTLLTPHGQQFQTVYLRMHASHPACSHFEEKSPGVLLG